MAKIENKKLLIKAKRYLVGGVNSPVRAFKYVDRDPLIIKNGKGSKIYDYEANQYIDYCLSWGSLILGHSHPKVIRDLRNTIKKGLSFGLTNELEIRLAKLILSAMPQFDKIRFVNSGTEALMSAVRLARGFTGRDKIIKFQNSYHGHADYLLAKAGSGLATANIPISKGVPQSLVKDTIIVPYGDTAALERAFDKYSDNVAAVLVEPVGGNYGVVLPDMGFLRYLRKITLANKALLIFDEVITGFRFKYGLAADKFGIPADIVCMGKIIGGGLPIGAYAAGNKIMCHLAPIGQVYQAGTFSGNPVVMQAGISTLSVLKGLKGEYEKLSCLGLNIKEELDSYARALGIGLRINAFGPMFSFKFEDKKRFVNFYNKVFGSGVFFVPSEFEANFISFAHTRRDIEKTITIAKKALEK